MKTKSMDRVGKALLLGTAGMLVATGAWAQQAVAQLKQVTGNVLVTREAGMATGTEAQPIMQGARVITTANSEVVVVFDNGCEVRLKENQRLEIDSRKPCAAMLVESLAVPPPPGPPLAGYIVPGLIGIGVLTGGGGSGGQGTTPVSPN